ncbi:MAG: PE family protein [Mycobacterium sp.]|nr:PE family protein [Mycobacterium sp.]
MTKLLAQPQAMAMAAENVAGIGSAINQARAAAGAPITGVVAAAADEVSAATTTLFNTFGRQYQAVIKQAGLFHDEFVEALAAAGNACAEAEIVDATMVSEVSGRSWAPLQAAMTPAAAAQDVALIMTSTPAPTLQLPIGPGLVDAVTGATSTGYPNLLPAADFANALLTRIPSYDVKLFLDGITQAASGDPAGLVNAVANPVAADMGLTVLIGGIDGLVPLGAAQLIAADFASLL